MKQKELGAGGDSVADIMETPVGKGVEAVNDVETTTAGKGKKLGIKRIKKKPDMNISKGKLKSVTTPKNFSFMNMSVQKQTLRANNRALAQNLAKARQDIRHLNTEMQTLRSQNQEQCLELNRLKRVVGLKDDQIDMEVQLRIRDEMQGMRSLLEELTQSMMTSSTFITKMNDKCLVYCSRRSTDSARSLGTSRGNQSLNRSNRRSSFKEVVNKDDLMAKYLSSADEYTAPPGSRVFSNDNNAADMSVIAEQSMLDSDGEMFTAEPLAMVDETIIEISPETAPPKSVSKLPQRVLKYNSSEAVKVNTDTSPEAVGTSSDTESTSQLSKSETAEKESKGKEKEKVRSKTNKRNEEKSGKANDKGKVCSAKDSKVNDDGEINRVIQKNRDRMNKDNKNESKDNNIDTTADISAFGFGGSFAADLVSGSPITVEKRRQTVVMSKQSEVSDCKTIEKEKKEETLVKSKKPDSTKSRKPEKDETAKKRDTFVLPKAPLQGAGMKEKKNSVKTGSNKSSVKDTYRNTKQKSNERPLESKEKRRDTYATENPFVPKNTNVQRSPVKPLNEEEEIYNTVENPFKPTKTLIRSPVHITVQSASPEKKVDSLAFLAKLRQSLDSNPVESLALPDPVFPDEPTTYFDSEMEFTSVIDSTKLLQTLSRSQKNSPVYPMETETKSGSTGVSASEHSNNVNNSSKDECQSRSGKSDTESQLDPNDVAAVEVRTKKPGVFTFSVARKEADGTRKAVPEKVSKARSKKKKPVTPEKEERRTGSDRDMFSFGDRTPTMPLDKLAKTKNVYDLSMNESVAVAPVSLKNFKEKEQKKVTETKPDDQIYYMPIKSGSPEEKPASKRARSQSRSRSKSRKKDDDDDEWVPGGKSRARSKSKGRTINDDETTERRGHSQSRKRVVDDSEMEENEEEKDRGRSKSRSRKVDKEETTDRRGRSQSRKRVVDDSEMQENEEKGRGRSKYRSRKVDKEETTDRRGRSQSRKRVVDDSEMEINEEEKCRGRSKSRSRKAEKEETTERQGRSRSCRRVSKEENGKDDTEVNREEELQRRRYRSRSRGKVLKNEDCRNDNKENEMQRKLDSESESVNSAVIDKEILGNKDEKKMRRGRSQSRARSKIDDESSIECKSKGTSESSELHLDEITLAPRRSARSKSQIRKPVIDDSDDDLNESPLLQRKSRSRSIHRRKTFEIKVDETDNELELEKDKVCDSKARTHDKETKLKAKDSTKVDRKSVIVIPDSDENESEENDNYRKSNYKDTNLESRHETVVNDESELKPKKVQKLERTPKMPQRHTKSTKYNKSDFEDNNEIKSKTNLSVKKKTEQDSIDDNIGRNFEFINKRRGKSFRTVADDFEIKESDNVETRKESLASVSDNAGEKCSESPETKKKVEEAKGVKSMKKSTKKRKQEELVSKTGKSRLNIAEKLVSDETVKSSSTPAMVPETSKKSAKKSRTGKSAKKTKVEHHPDQTPVSKEEKSNSQIYDKPSALALLKKRLTMVGMKHTVKEDIETEDQPSRKRSQAELDEQQNDGCESPENKRTRRNKNPVSYVSKPLNVKLRRGDEMFQETAMSKVKAEQSRLMIAKKTNVPKVSRDDKENVAQI